MSQDFFKNLPSEITLNILSRLPAKTTMKCKCVCKPWLNLLTTPEFVKSHISKSVPGLAVITEEIQSKPFKIVEFVDEVDLNCDDHHGNIVFNLDLPFDEPLHSSANGLLFLCKLDYEPTDDLFLCNPITREYIKLPSPRQPYPEPMIERDTYGFGVSKITGQYKVVRMFFEEKLPLAREINWDQSKCQVYTVGSGSWRRISSGEPLMYPECGGTFLNGNLHFLSTKDYKSLVVSCLDLETERFSTFSFPLPFDSHKYRIMSVLWDCLCVCDNSADEFTCGFEIDIWLMKECGDEKSWTKEFVIRKVIRDDYLGYLRPIKVFKDGDILMELECCKLLYYSSKTKTIRVKLSGLPSDIVLSSMAVYAPSFLPLKTIAMENVSSF